MPSHQGRISSFSMIEMLVVLILSSIVVGIIYFSWYTMNTYQVSLASKFRSFEDVSSLLYILREDIDRSDIINKTENGFSCKTVDDQSEVEYAFGEGFVARNQVSRSDTFYCKPVEVTLMFEKKRVLSNDVPVNEIVIGVRYLGDLLSFHHVKSYDSRGLINFVKRDTIE